MTPASVTIEEVMASMAARCGCGVSSLTIIGVTTKIVLPMAAPTTSKRDLEAGRRHAADEGQDAAAQGHGGRREDAAAEPARDAGLLEALREPAAGQHDAHAEDPGQDGEVAAHRLAVAQAVDQVGGEPGEAERQPPVAGEAGAAGGDDAGAGEQMAVRHALDHAARRPGRLVDQRAFAAEDQPQHRPRRGPRRRARRTPSARNR